jgi:hypothetical protein
MEIKELPTYVTQLLEELDAPTRLRKHLQIVYSTAEEIVGAICEKWPALPLNKQQVLIGAATHDIGKAEHPEELVEPGNNHLEAGYNLLLNQGYSKESAQFALTHEDWNNPERSLEELLVSLSDLIWNGIRNDTLEELVIKKIAERLQAEYWDVFMEMDPILMEIAKGADERLSYQGS